MARVSSEPPAQEKPEPAAAAEPPVPEPTIATSGADVPTSAEDVWRAEYESHVEEWRARSAEQREKAEVEREKWEAVRAQEEREAKARAKELSESVTSGWESVRPDTEAGASPSPADARDLVAGEQQGHGQAVSVLCVVARNAAAHRVWLAGSVDDVLEPTSARAGTQPARL